MIEVGKKCPAFKLPSDEETTVSLSELKGQPFVLFFYPKDDTSGCTKEAIAFTDNVDAFDTIGIRIFGVSPDSIASHQKFKKKHELGVVLLADEDRQLAEKFGVWVEKNMYGRKYMGIERSTFLIDETGKIVEAWRKVKVPGHAEKVLKAARDMISG